MASFAELLDILFEDNHCLGLNKPAGWPTTHYDGTEETVDRLAKAYIKEKYNKSGNVFLGVVHRLDKPTSGALLFAKTSKAAARLSEQFRDSAVEKVYWAVATEAPPKPKGFVWGDWGTLDDWLFHDDAERLVKVVPEGTEGAKPARTGYQVKARHAGLMLLELRPLSGRKHQLRVQLASRGAPIFADKKYGGTHVFGAGIGLHARSLTFLHPILNDPVTLKAEVPKEWKGRFAYLLNPGAKK